MLWKGCKVIDPHNTPTKYSLTWAPWKTEWLKSNLFHYWMGPWNYVKLQVGVSSKLLPCFLHDLGKSLRKTLWVHFFRWSWVHEAKIPTSLKHPCTSWSKKIYQWSPWKSFQTHNLSIFSSTKCHTQNHATVGISANKRHDKLHLSSLPHANIPVTSWAWCGFLSLTLSEKNMFLELLNLDLRNHVDIWTLNSYLLGIFDAKMANPALAVVYNHMGPVW